MKKPNQIVEYLFSVIPLKRCLNNHKIFISYICPFCGAIGKSKRIFRYNSHLKVGKSYCCGCSFKDLYWLKVQIGNPNFVDEWELENKIGFYETMDDEHYINYKIYRKENNIATNSFEKSDADNLDLPF